MYKNVPLNILIKEYNLFLSKVYEQVPGPILYVSVPRINQMEKKNQNLKDVRDVYQRILEEKQCVSLKTLAINGKDLIDQTGMKPGKELGEVLNELLDLVTEDPARNTREYLLKAAKERLKR